MAFLTANEMQKSRCRRPPTHDCFGQQLSYMPSTTRPSSSLPGSMLMIGKSKSSPRHCFMFLSDYIIANSCKHLSKLTVRPKERYRPLVSSVVIANPSCIDHRHATTLTWSQQGQEEVLDHHHASSCSNLWSWGWYHHHLPTGLSSRDLVIDAPPPPCLCLARVEQGKAPTISEVRRKEESQPPHQFPSAPQRPLACWWSATPPQFNRSSSDAPIRMSHKGELQEESVSSCDDSSKEGTRGRKRRRVSRKNNKNVTTQETTTPIVMTLWPPGTCSADKESSTRFRQRNQSGNWMERYTELVDFKSKHGHCFVPNNYKENPPLAEWVKRQRYQYKLRNLGEHNSMTLQRIEKLEKLGFVWNSHGQLWEERLNDLKVYIEINGDCNVPSRYPPDPSLAAWVKRQRRQYKFFLEGKESSLTPYRIKMLTDVGFFGKDVTSRQLRTTRS